MSDIQVEEYKILRQEHENNRKFVFERPLVILGVIFASMIKLEKQEIGFLPIPFLLVLLFNLSFTLNRLQSSARIIAYLQLIHEPGSMFKWVGWESSLRRFRENYNENNPANNQNIFLRILRLFRWEKLNHRSNDPFRYYPMLYYFHLISGILVTFLLIYQSNPDLLMAAHLHPERPQIWPSLNLIALMFFVLSCSIFHHGRLASSIEDNYDIWRKVLPSLR